MREKRNGRTLEEWMREASAVLQARMRKNPSPDRAFEVLARNPCWDYWASGYSPTDAAREMPLL
jgi:hypothetical protein